MPTVVQLRRGTTAQNDSFTGAIGELSYDITTKELRTHDGSTQGGKTLATKDFVTTSVFSGEWDDITGKPTFAAVALSGDYTDLSNSIDLQAITVSPTPSTGLSQSLGTQALQWNNVHLGNDGIYLGSTGQISKVVDVGTGDISFVVSETSVSESRITLDVRGKFLANEVTVEEDLRVAGASAADDGVATFRMVGNELLILSSLSGEHAVTPGAGGLGTLGTAADPWNNSYVNSLNITADVSGSFESKASITANHVTQQVSITPNSDFDLVLNVTGDGNIIAEAETHFSKPITVMLTSDIATDVPNPANGMIVYNETTNKFVGYANGAWVDLH